MHDMKKLETMLTKELDEMVGQGKISSGSLDVLHKITDTIKNIKKIEMLCEGEDGEYSQRYYDNGSYRRGYMRDGMAYTDGSYRDGYSERRSRDAMGRFTDNGHDHIIAKAGELMQIATDEEDRRAVEKLLRELNRR